MKTINTSTPQGDEKEIKKKSIFGLNKKPKKKETPLEVIRSVVVLLLILLAIRTFIWEPFRIPSESMLPRLEIGDFISVNKMAYGYSKKSPSFFTIPFLPDGRLKIVGKDPKRGDIIVFKRSSDNRILIKRLMGLPGDHIKVTNGIVYVNDVALRREKLTPKVKHQRSNYIFTRYREYMPDGQNYIIYEAEAAQRGENRIPVSGTLLDNTETFIVPDKNYFFMGDDRDLSADSREWGYVEETNLLGRAILINFNFFQSLKGKRIFKKMYTDEDYDDYQKSHSLD